MKEIVVFVILFCVVKAFSKEEHTTNMLQQKHVITKIEKERINSRIVNGQVAHPNQFPYMAGLMFRNVQKEEITCGGSLISYEWVITAAHCINNKVIVFVFLGNIVRAKGEIRHALRQNMFIHPNFSTVTASNDIGVINFTPPVTHSPAIVPIALPTADFHIDIGSIGVVSGWGQIYTNGPMSPTLLYTDARVITINVCNRVYRTNIDDTKLCTVPALGGSTCDGDSGGPLVVGPSQVLIGVISFHSYNGCFTGYPDVYTRITSYLPWIHNKTGT